MSVTIVDPVSHNPPEKSCRTTTRRYVCTECRKCVDYVINPGVIDILVNCTLTENCGGTLAMDKNAKLTPSTELTHWITSPTIKAEFRAQRVITVTHNFGHVGSIIVDVFLYMYNAGSLVVRKTTEFKIVDKSKTQITIELTIPDYKGSGKIVLTDNQYVTKVPNFVVASKTIPVTSNGIFTIALDYFKDTAFAPTNSTNDNSLVLAAHTRYVTQSNQHQSFDGIVDHPINFYCHAANHYSSVVAASAFSSLRILVAGKPYYLYSAEIPGGLLNQRGTSVVIDLTVKILNSTTIGIGGFIPHVIGSNTRAGDVCTTSVVYLNHLKIGDIISDGNQWIVGNNNVISTVSPPLIKI